MNPSSLSLAVLALREALAAALGLPAPQIAIGTPWQAQQRQQQAPDESLLNLFVYQVVPAGWPADALLDEAGHLRLRCLVTPMAAPAGSDAPAAGEADLRTLGAVAAALHAQPALSLAQGDTVVAQVQVVPLTLAMEDLNPMWSSQPGVPYRASLAYEIGLLPVPLGAQAHGVPRVAQVDLGVQAGSAADALSLLPLWGQIVPPGPPMQGLQLCWLDTQQRPCHAMSMPGQGEGPVAPLVALGPEGLALDLAWECWQPGGRWVECAGAEGLPPAAPKAPPLDDGAAWQALARPVPVPLSGRGQALLRATAGALRSNALLLTLT